MALHLKNKQIRTTKKYTKKKPTTTKCHTAELLWCSRRQTGWRCDANSSDWYKCFTSVLWICPWASAAFMHRRVKYCQHISVLHREMSFCLCEWTVISVQNESISLCSEVFATILYCLGNINGRWCFNPNNLLSDSGKTTLPLPDESACYYTW